MKANTTAVTIGTFDGFHRGHKSVVETLRAEAAARCLEPTVIGFDRHPLDTIAPERSPRLICSPEKRKALLRNEGVDVIEMEFTSRAAAMTTREYMRYLRDTLGVALIIIGYDNTFGSDGLNMSVTEYMDLGKEEGIEVLEAPVVEGVSSSIVRKTIASGDIEKAAEMLGRDFSIEGTVVHGHGIGHTLGFPTANVRPTYKAVLPKNGVYTAIATLPGGENRAAIVNVGVRPTLGNSPEPQIEAHIIDFDRDLYGSNIILRFKSRIRDEKKFESMEELKKGIAADISEAKNRFFL